MKCFSERAIQPDRGGAVAVQGRDIKAGTGGRTASGTGTAVSVDSWNPFTIDGVIYRDTSSKTLLEDAEIFLLPRLAAG